MSPDLSVIATTYGQPKTLDAWLDQMHRWPTDSVQVVIIDDCGDPRAFKEPNYRVRNLVLLRVDEDIPWNQPGARNLGIAHAKAPVLLIVDGDMELAEEMAPSFLEAACGLTPGKVIIPSIRYQMRNEINNVHAHNYLIRKDDMAQLGGYDEDYCGHYGWEDVQMLHLMEKLFFVDRRLDLWVRHLDGVEDHAVTKLSRDTERNRALHLRKLDEMKKLGAHAFAAQQRQAATIRFPWHRVF